MKTGNKLFWMLAASVLSFAGCEIVEVKDAFIPETVGSTFELVADIAQTRTTVDPEDGYKVSWEEGDVIYMVTDDETWGKPYESSSVTNIETIAEFVYGDGKFTTEATIDDGEYTFNAMYCAADNKSWHRGAGSTHKLSAVQNQDCTNPTAHIKNYDALVGTFTATLPVENPQNVAMHHIYTLMQVNVVNNTGAAIEVAKFEMTVGGADLVGIFNVDDFATSATSVKTGYGETITVNVSNGTVSADESLPIYFVVSPFTSDAEKGITFKVTDASGNTYTKTVNKAITFSAGTYNTTPYTITKADEVEEGAKTVTFDFTSSAELQSLGITLPDISKGTNISSMTLAKGDVSFNSTDGSTNTRVWNSSGEYDLRAYKGATITLTVPSGYVITEVTVKGTETSGISLSAIPSSPVVLTIGSDADTQKISSITVVYEEGEVPKIPLVMSGVECSNATTTSLTFEWEAVTGSVGYQVSLDGGNTYKDITTATTYTWNDLVPETEYTIYVKAIGNGQNTSDSEAVSAVGVTVSEGSSVLVYTFKTAKNASNTSYGTVYDVTIDNIKWSVPGNQNFSGYVRIGGKGINNTTRVIYSKNAINDNISRIIMSTNGISNKTFKVNSITLKVFSNAEDASESSATPLTAITNTDSDWAASTAKEIVFERPDGADWKNRFYRIEFNVTNSNTSSNYGIDLQTMEFYN